MQDQQEREDRDDAALLLASPSSPNRSSSNANGNGNNASSPAPRVRARSGSDGGGSGNNNNSRLLGGHSSNYYGSTQQRQQHHPNPVVRFDDDDGFPRGGAAATSPTAALRFAVGGHEDNDTVTNSSTCNVYNEGSESSYYNNDDLDDDDASYRTVKYLPCLKIPSLRKLALLLSLNVNIVITVAKLVAYLQSYSLSVLAALLDSLLDILSQLVLNYTERHSTMQRSSAHYPAGASRLEPIGVLTCAALMGMASFEVVKESVASLAAQSSPLADNLTLASFYNMLGVILAKLLLLQLCNVAAHRKTIVLRSGGGASRITSSGNNDEVEDDAKAAVATIDEEATPLVEAAAGAGAGASTASAASTSNNRGAVTVQLADPTLEAIAQDHFNDVLSNGVAAVALLVALRDPRWWFLDPLGAIAISVYIIYSWYRTGREQIEHLTGKSAPEDLIDELKELAENFDDRMQVDVVRAYHFGPKFLVEIEVVMPKTTLLFESHDVGMELQYEIESREEIERCFVHIDYQQRPYDEHVVSKVPELREKYRPKKQRSTLSL
jgi:cation diffusion facilitator family transporter